MMLTFYFWFLGPLMVWVLQTRPKSSPTGWTVRSNHYLDIMFSTFSGVIPLQLHEQINNACVETPGVELWTSYIEGSERYHWAWVDKSFFLFISLYIFFSSILLKWSSLGGALRHFVRKKLLHLPFFHQNCLHVLCNV